MELKEIVQNMFYDFNKYMLYLQEALNSNDIFGIDRMYSKTNFLANMLYNGKIIRKS